MSTQTAPDRHLERDGANLRWRLDGAGPAIVLLHGWALDLEYWEPLATLLAPRFTVLRFDRRGFGASSGMPDIHRNVDDLLALLDAAQLERAVILGMSQGARLALHFAARHPLRTRALVLDGAPAFEAESELPLERYRAQLEARQLAGLQADILRHPLMRLHTQDAATHRQLADIVARYTGLDLLHPVAHAAPPRLDAITAPALILNGSCDGATRLFAGEALQAKLLNAQRVQLPDSGHLAALDDPQRYAAAIMSFCRPLPP